MLKFLRHKHVSKIIFWALVILILPAFVLWGTGSIGRSGAKGPKYVGIINNKKVTFDEFAENLSSVRAQIFLNYFNQPKMLDIFLKNPAFLGRYAWDRILMSREAAKRRIKVSDPDVISAIRSHPIFVRNGRFDDRIYEYVLRNNLGLYPRNFEEIVRENLAIQKLNDLTAKDVKVADGEALEEYRKDNDKFKLAYVIIPSTNFLDRDGVNDEKVKEYYEARKQEFRIPTKSAENPKEITFTEAKFEDVKDGIRTRLAQEQAKPLAAGYGREVRKQIVELMDKGKLSFEDACLEIGLAPDRSGFLSKSDYLEGIGEASALVEAAAKLEKDDVSDVVETRKGALIFKILEDAGFDEDAFKEKKDEYAKRLLDRKKSLILEEWLIGLEKSAKLNIDLSDYEKYYR